MTPNPEYQNLPPTFWAALRSLSQHCGYTKKGGIRIPTLDEMRAGYTALNLEPAMLDLPLQQGPRSIGEVLAAYFTHRAKVITHELVPSLMTGEEARAEFERLRAKFNPRCPLPKNKQKGEMRKEAYLTCIVNILVEAHSGGSSVDYDPQELTTVTGAGAPVRTLARRVDGAFPSTINPVAIWEVKEYYYNKSFGSRIADGVYETMLDGMELEELRASAKVDVLHYLMFDARNTWWTSGGKPYLCRIVDMLHMGFVDEALAGRQVIERLPELIPMWVERLRERKRA